MVSWEVVYVCAGVVLPLFYLPQIRRCSADQSGLASYSLRKAGFQFVLRVVMMPFITQVGSPTMTFVVALDLAGRGAELLAAVLSLRAQGSSWVAIGLRLALRSHTLASTNDRPE